MRAMPIIAVKPSRQFGGSFMLSVVGASIGPFAQARLDEALGLSVGLWCVRLGEDVLEAKRLQARAKALER